MNTTPVADGVYGYPLSFAQRRLWFMDQLFPGTAIYNLPLVLHLAQPVDIPVLERVLAEMARRHESLRTTFDSVDGEPVQVVHDEGAVRVLLHALDRLPPGDREAAAMAFATATLQRPFDLVHGPLWRATLVRLDRADHLLLLTAHHIVSDGWSMGLILRELQALYTAFARGEESPLPALPLQYVDYAIWQREHLSPDVLERQLAYWRETLADLPTIELPTDRARPTTPSLGARRHHFSIPPRLRRALDDLARSEGATPFMLLLAVFAALLQRYTGDSDVPIGTPIAGRGRAEFEPLIGFFVNTLVLRVDLEGDPTFLALLQSVRERALEAYTYQDLPFERLVEELQPARDLTKNPLFQVMFALQNAPTHGPEAPGPLRSVEIDSGFTSLDLALDVWPRGDGYAARLEYGVDLFDADTIERMTEHWLTLLDAIVAAPQERVSSFSLRGSGEDDAAASPMAGAIVPEPLDTTVGALIRTRAMDHPHLTAVVADVCTLTYGDVHQAASTLAARLHVLGVGPDRPVAILLDRSPALVVAMLAIWYAGGTYLPIDAADPDLRVRQVLDDIEPVAIITEENHRSRCMPLTGGDPARAGAALIIVDPLSGMVGGTKAETEHEARTPLAAATHQEQLAYVVYTSGSTGQPSGVAVEHRALLNHVRWMQSAFPLAPGDRTIQTTSPAFDVSLWELAAPLVWGATIVVPPREAVAEPARVAALLAEHDISVLQTTPSFLTLLLDVPGFDKMPGLRWVFCGAESMPRELAERFARRGIRATLVNMYGPTEAAIDSASFACPADGVIPETRSGSVPIGRPIDNVRLHVLDTMGRAVPTGLPGELCVAGASVARGYWRRPGITAERFVAEPGAGPGSRMYRSGDRVRVLRSGDIELLGRMDRQVKIRGVRVELAEVERGLCMHPGVTEAHVRAVRHPNGETRLAAYVAIGDAVLDAHDLREFLAARFTAPMIPATFSLIPALPRTSRGKVDAPALARLATAGDTQARTVTEPRTETEATLREIWQAILGVTRIGITENFFDLGGHSLMATQVVSRVLDRFQFVVPLRVFFERPTIERLARYIAELPSGIQAEVEQVVALGGRPATDELARLSDHEVDQLLRVLVERDASR